MKSLARIATVCAVMMSTITLSSCSSDGEDVTAQFVSAAPLVEGNQVKLDGVVVGKITRMRVRHGLAEVTMHLDRQVLPLHSDATFMIRPASLLGERYVDVKRGSPSAPALDTSRPVPTSRTATNVGLDDMLNTMDEPASNGLAMLVDTLGTGVRGNGTNVDKTITSLSPNMKEIDALVAVLKNHNELLGALVSDSEPILAALADKDGQSLDRLVGSSDELLRATAAQQDDLRQTISQLPGTLKSGRRTLSSVSKTADNAAPTLKAMEPFTKHLPKISKELNKFSDALDPALSSSEPVLDRAEQLVLEAQRPADDLRIASPKLATTVHGTSTIVSGLSQNREAMFTFIKRWALNLNGQDGLSHYWRVSLTLNRDSWTDLLSLMGGTALPTTTAQAPAAAAKDSTGTPKPTIPGVPLDAPEVVDGLVKPLTGLTKGLTDGSLLKGKTSADGSNTGLDKKQESNLLGFLFGGGE